MLGQIQISASKLMAAAGFGLLAYCLISIVIFWAYTRTRLYPLYVLKICWVGLTIVGFVWIVTMSLADPGPKHGGVAQEYMKNPAGPFAALGDYAPAARDIRQQSREWIASRVNLPPLWWACQALYLPSPWWLFALAALLLLWRGLADRRTRAATRLELAFSPRVFRAAAAMCPGLAGLAAVLMWLLAGSVGLPHLLVGAALLVLAIVSAKLPRVGFGVFLLPGSALVTGLVMWLLWTAPIDAAQATPWMALGYLLLWLCGPGHFIYGVVAIVPGGVTRKIFLPVSTLLVAAGVLVVDGGMAWIIALLRGEAGPIPWSDLAGAGYFAGGCILWIVLPRRLRHAISAWVLLALGLAALVPLVLALARFDWSRYKYIAENYAYAWNTAHMGKYMLNSVMVSLLTVGITTLCASMAAYALTRFEFKGRSLVLFGFIGAMVIPAQLYIVPLFLMVQDWQISAGDLHFSFMDSRLGLSLIYAAAGLPFATFLLTGFYRTLPGSLREAAAIDGCGEWQLFTDVYFPLAAPGMATAAIFQFIGVWNEYQFALVFLTNDKLKTLPVGLYNLSVSQQYAANWSALFAGITILCLPTFLIFVILQERIVAGLTVGAVKE